MNQNTNKASLKGKRKKPVPANANPLFTQWLTEWRDEAVEKGWKSHHTYSKALKTLKMFPVTLKSGKDCKLLQNFGDKICKMLDEKLAKHQKNNDPVPVQEPQERAKETSQKAPSSSQNHSISDNSDSEPELQASPPKKKRQTSQRKAKEYVPGYKSGPYAIMLTLYRYMQDPDFKGFMTKRELCHSSQPLSEKSFTRPDPGSHYTAWSSMSSLIKRGLVHKDGCPARYVLTDEGLALGSKLKEVENGNSVDNLQSSSDSNTGGNCIKDSNPSLDRIQVDIAHKPAFSSSGPVNTVQPSTHIVLSDSEEECDNEVFQNIPQESDFLQNPDICHDPVYILSDDEDQDVGTSGERAPVFTRHMRLHSLSPSSSLSPPPHDFDEPLVSLNNPLLNYSPSLMKSSPVKKINPLPHDIDDKDIIEIENDEIVFRSESHISKFSWEAREKKSVFNTSQEDDIKSSPVKKLPLPAEVDDGDVIEVENDDNAHLINFSSESPISKFSWEAKTKQNIFHTTQDDDDELPDLDQYIPLSKRLMSKGFTSSSLLKSHGSSTGSENFSSSSKSCVEKQADVDSGTDVDNAIDLESIKMVSSGKCSYTSMKEKNADNFYSLKASASSVGSMDKLPCDGQQISSVSSAQSHPSALESSNSHPVPLFTFQPDTFDVVLCVDQREFYGSKSNSKTLLPDLIKSGINCDLRHLNISDLLWVARERSTPSQSLNNLTSARGRELVLNYAIERKRMDDLVSSISSGRLKEQKFRLKHSGISELIILIEEYGSIQNFSLSEDRIKQSIVNSQIIDGFKVKRCASAKDAITYLSLMTRFLQSHYHSKTLHAVSHEWLKDNKKSCINESEQYLMPFDVFNEASLKQKTLSVKEMFAKQLLQIPGISLERASAITKVYPTMSLLIAAYKKCDSDKTKESLLASIKCGNKQRNLGIAVSRTVSMMYNTKGPLP